MRFRLGDIISPYKQKNTDLSCGLGNLKGISIKKAFIETKADMTDVSLHNYLIVPPDAFAYVTITSRKQSLKYTKEIWRDDVFDKDHLMEALVSYKREFTQKLWPNEKYKWEAIKFFQANWDVNAADFAAMLTLSLSKTFNLLASANNFPAQ